MQPGVERLHDDVPRIESFTEVFFVLVDPLVEVRKEPAVITGVLGVAVVPHEGDVHAVVRLALNAAQTELFFEPDGGFLLDLFLSGEGGCGLARLVIQIVNMPC